MFIIISNVDFKLESIKDVPESDNVDGKLIITLTNYL